MSNQRRILRNILLVLTCLVLAAGAYLFASRFMESLFSYRSPLQNTPPPPGLPAGAGVSKRVVVILVDALRLDTSLDAEAMPFLNELRSQAAVAHMRSRPPSYSQPGYTAILTGAWPDIHDGPPINLSYEEIPVFTQDDLFSAAHAAGLSTAVSGYNWFEKLIPQAAVELSFYTPGEDHAADLDVMAAALPWLRTPSNGLVLIHLDQVDYAGHHEGGPRDPHWNQAANRVDGMIREIHDALDLSRDTLLVISDHGQIDSGGHGGQDAITLSEPFVLLGAGVIPGDYGTVEMVDVAPTVAVLLGSRIPASAQGAPLLAALDFTGDQKEAILRVLDRQQGQLFEYYRAAVDPAWSPKDPELSPLEQIDALRDDRLLRERALRLLPALLVTLGPLFWIVRRWGRDSAWLLAGGILIIAVFHARYVFIEGKTYSLSSINSVDDLVTDIALGMGVGLALSLAVLIPGMRLHRRDPSGIFDAVMNLILITIYLLTLPAAWHATLNGLLVSWTLPDFGSAFVGFLSLMQVIFIAAWGLLAAGAGMAAAWLAKAIRSAAKPHLEGQAL